MTKIAVGCGDDDKTAREKRIMHPISSTCCSKQKKVVIMKLFHVAAFLFTASVCQEGRPDKCGGGIGGKRNGDRGPLIRKALRKQLIII